MLGSSFPAFTISITASDHVECGRVNLSIPSDLATSASSRP